MAGKKKEITLQMTILSQEQWDEMLAITGLTVVDVYQAWCGPCKAVISLFRKIKNELGDDHLHFAVLQVLFYFNTVTTNKSYTVAIIKPDAVAHGKANEIIMKIREAGFKILAHEERTLTKEDAHDFYRHKAEEAHFEELIQFMSSGPCHILILSRPEGTVDVIPLWREFIGPTDVEVAKQEKPESLRALYGTEHVFNAVHGSDDMDHASRELAFFFPSFGKASEAQIPIQQEERVQKTLALIRPDLLKERKDDILRKIAEAGFTIALQKEVVLTEKQVYEFYSEHTQEEYFPVLLQNMTSGPVLALALASMDAVERWRNLLGPKDVNQAKEEDPESLRAQFSIETVPINQLHGSGTPQEAEKELKFFFSMEHTLAAIKPDTLEEHRDEIIQKIKQAGFIISHMDEKTLSREMAEEFYKEHKGKPFFEQLVDYMSEGPLLMMILSKENAVEEWRNLMGPTDPEEAKQTAPDSLRAKFAKNILQNALHGSPDQLQAMEKIQFVFGDINIGADGVVQGIEPDLEKVICPESREESEGAKLETDQVERRDEATVDNESAPTDSSQSTVNESSQSLFYEAAEKVDSDDSLLPSETVEKAEKTTVDSKTPVDSSTNSSQSTVNDSSQSLSHEVAEEKKVDGDDEGAECE
ncbi:thioredoxin domain-containing protein 6-like [Rhincodon typus]|uniref:thioredoxin domain-containing protein 6-like n=1 Tax=Rhincodon typus TaxID=259920 RepID=UPI002030E3DA|nr:thioredoxin domain-containing protein 6-like [Rhincodon typus]